MKHSRIIGRPVAVAVATVALAAPAYATTATVDGGYGIWDYGRSSGKAWSNYLNSRSCHGSSVYGGGKSDSDTAPKYAWSIAEITGLSWYQKSQAYYRSYC